MINKSVVQSYLVLLFISGFCKTFAQAPDATYINPQPYIINTQITPLIPTNTGGVVNPVITATVSTFAGSTYGFADGQGTAAQIKIPEGIAVGKDGTVYVSDPLSTKIRKITPDGMVTTIAGSSIGYVDGPAATAKFNFTTGIAVDASNNIYVAEEAINVIRKISSTGIVTTFAGSGNSGNVDGIGKSASFDAISELTFDQAGNIYAVEGNMYGKKRFIVKITPSGVVTTFAGGGVPGVINGPVADVNFGSLVGIVMDGDADIYVLEPDECVIKKITPAGIVSTLAGSGAKASVDGFGAAASFYHCIALAIEPSGVIYVSDFDGNKIRLIRPDGTVTTIAGSGQAGSQNGIGAAATFHGPGPIAIDGTGISYIADLNNYIIRKAIVTGYHINKFLPPGLKFDISTGIISGIPTSLWPPTDYTVTATNLDGSSYKHVTISVVNAVVVSPTLKPIVVPNTFTPNNDGVNDKWNIDMLQYYPGCTVQVYNRYGVSVYHSVNYAQAWDGTYNNTPLPTGTYYYIIDPKNNQAVLSGSITIIR